MWLLFRPFENFIKWFYNLIFTYDYDGSFGDYFVSALLFIISVVICLMIIGGIVYGIHSIIDSITSFNREIVGKVIDKKYIGESTTSGTGTALMSNGSVGIISTSSTKSEEFLIFVDSDQVYKVETDMQTFYHLALNDLVTLNQTMCGISKQQLSIEIKK